MKPKHVWIGMVVGLLLMSVCIQAVAIVLAVGDPSFAVEPDYEAKAANYEAIQRQRATNERLGWEVEFRALPSGAPGRSLVELALTDRAGRPVEGAAVRLEAFHNARAAQVLRAELPSVGAGSFAAELPIVRPGIWEFRLEATRGEDRFTATLRRSILPTVPAGVVPDEARG